MSDEYINPYRPPLESSKPPPRLSETGALASLILVLIAVVAYHGFVWVLTRSNGPDRQAGLLFLLNSPVMLVWIAAACRRRGRAYLGGVASALTQIAIAALMLAIGIGEWEPVCVINGLIAGGLATLSWVCWALTRRDGLVAG